MAEQPTLSIPRDIIEPLIQARIQSAIVEAMGGQQDMLERAVLAVLFTHRDRDGKPCNKGAYGDAGSFLESTARKYIEEATREALKTYFETKKPDITKAIEREMRKHHGALVEAFFNGLKNASGGMYTSVSFTVGAKS